jgi:hypothetical protein
MASSNAPPSPRQKRLGYDILSKVDTDTNKLLRTDAHPDQNPPSAKTTKVGDKVPTAKTIEVGDKVPSAKTIEVGDKVPTAKTTKGDEFPTVKTTKVGDKIPSAKTLEVGDQVPTVHSYAHAAKTSDAVLREQTPGSLSDQAHKLYKANKGPPLPPTSQPLPTWECDHPAVKTDSSQLTLEAQCKALKQAVRELSWYKQGAETTFACWDHHVTYRESISQALVQENKQLRDELSLTHDIMTGLRDVISKNSTSIETLSKIVKQTSPTPDTEAALAKLENAIATKTEIESVISLAERVRSRILHDKEIDRVLDKLQDGCEQIDDWCIGLTPKKIIKEGVDRLGERVSLPLQIHANDKAVEYGYMYGFYDGQDMHMGPLDRERIQAARYSGMVAATHAVTRQLKTEIGPYAPARVADIVYNKGWHEATSYHTRVMLDRENPDLHTCTAQMHEHHARQAEMYGETWQNERFFGHDTTDMKKKACLSFVGHPREGLKKMSEETRCGYFGEVYRSVTRYREYSGYFAGDEGYPISKESFSAPEDQATWQKGRANKLDPGARYDNFAQKRLIRQTRAASAPGNGETSIGQSLPIQRRVLDGSESLQVPGQVKREQKSVRSPPEPRTTAPGIRGRGRSVDRRR